MRYTDLFIDFDDTLYDTYGNAVIALRETFEVYRLNRYFPDPQVFYDAYWAANIDLWGRYSKGEITRDYLIVERFRRPLMVSDRFRAEADSSLSTHDFSLKLSDTFLDFCASKPGVIDGAHELMDYLKAKGYRMHLCSNGFHEVQYKKLAACGMRDYFDTIILSEDAGANKPSKAFFDYALQRSGASSTMLQSLEASPTLLQSLEASPTMSQSLEASPTMLQSLEASPTMLQSLEASPTTLMIGDNLQTDILGALNAGLDAMLFNRWNVDFTAVTPSPTFVVESLRDIMTIL